MSFMGLFELFKRQNNASKPAVAPPVYAMTEMEDAGRIDTSDAPDSIPANVAEVLTAKLFFEGPPVVDGLEILSELRKKYQGSNIERLGNTLVFTLLDPESVSGGAAKWCILVSENMEIQPLPNEAFRQNWHWREAAGAIRFCKYEILITEKMVHDMPYKQRLVMFSDFLTSVIKAVHPSVVYSKNAEKLLEPNDVAACNLGTEADMLHPVTNIRMFKIADNAEGNLLMDTIGLHALGLPDIEIVFGDRNPAKIGELLLRYSNFIFDIGDNVRDGEYLEGTTPTERWKCEKRYSMLLPERYVLHLTPEGDN
jgi:Domain of unknown function (DUF4261)